MTVHIGSLILLATSLFSIISPPAAIGTIAAVSGDHPRPAQRRIAIGGLLVESSNPEDK